MKCSFDFEGSLVIEAENTAESVALQTLFFKELDDERQCQFMSRGDNHSFGPEFAKMTLKFMGKEA